MKGGLKLKNNCNFIAYFLKNINKKIEPNLKD